MEKPLQATLSGGLSAAIGATPGRERSLALQLDKQLDSRQRLLSALSANGGWEKVAVWLSCQAYAGQITQRWIDDIKHETVNTDKARAEAFLNAVVKLSPPISV